MTAPLVLALDASTYAGSVAVIRAEQVLAECDVAMRGATAERLMPAVVEVLRAAGVAATDLGRVVCGSGPGSFTSLRIAASIGKGFASARALPLYALPSLALIVAGNDLPRGRYAPVLDAMRGDVYVAGYELAEQGIAEIEPFALIPRSALADWATTRGAHPIGPAEMPGVWPRARGVARLGAWIDAATPVDLARWEPHYGRMAEAQVRWERAHGRPLSGA